MWPFPKRSSVEEVDVGPPLDQHRICLGGNGTLSVVLAFAFLLGAFAAHRLVYRSTKRQDAKAEAAARKTKDRKGLLRQQHRGGWLEWIEESFVSPFTPTTLEHFVLVIFFLWFMFTMTMGITRYYRKIWAVEMLGEHFLFNYAGYLFFACKGKDLMTVVYTEEIPENSVHMPDPEPYSNSPAEVDSYILPHITWAMAWLFMGFVQIYMARSKWSTNETTHIRVHKAFGTVALLSLAAHLHFAFRIAHRDPVNQITLIKHGYYGLVLEVFSLAFYGVRCAIKHGKETDADKKENYLRMHRFRMITCWLQATFGSGAIRVTFWFTWICGHFFSPDWKRRIDRTSCQIEAHDKGQVYGSAQDCMVPVSLNLNLTNLLITWLIWILFQLTEYTDQDREAFIARFKMSLAVVAASLAIIPLGYYWPWTEEVYIILMWPLTLLSKMQSLHDIQRALHLDKIAEATKMTEYVHGALFGGYHKEEEEEAAHED